MDPFSLSNDGELSVVAKSFPKTTKFTHSVGYKNANKLFSTILRSSHYCEDMSSHYKKYLSAHKKIQDEQKAVIEKLLKTEGFKKDQQSIHLGPFSNTRISQENKIKDKQKARSSRKSILSIRGKEISPNRKNIFAVDQESKDYFQTRYLNFAERSPKMGVFEKPVPIKPAMEEISDDSSDFSTPHKYEGQKPPFRIKKKEHKAGSRKLKPTLVLTPEMTNKHTFDKEINKHTSRIREVKEKFKLKSAFKKPKISTKLNTSSNFWKKKRSLSKEKQKVETERKIRKNVLLNSALFLKNKNSVEEALGGDENQLYRKSIYGLFQLGKDFQAKYIYQEKVEKQLRSAKNRSYLNKTKDSFRRHRNTISNEYYDP